MRIHNKMQMSVGQAFTFFNKFLSSIDYAMVENRKDNVENFLRNNLGFTIHERLNSGSDYRGTAIQSYSDVDMIFVVAKHQTIRQPNFYFDELENRLKRASTIADLWRHAISFTYKDFKFDAVLGIINPYGKLMIADRDNNMWEETDPEETYQALNRLNQNEGSKLIPTIRFLKQWNYRNNIRFKSFHLESICFDQFNRYDYSKLTWSSCVKNIANSLLQYVDKSIDEPAKIGPQLYVPNKYKTQLKSQIIQLQGHTKTAYNCENNGNTQEAILSWKQIFGKQFGKKS